MTKKLTRLIRRAVAKLGLTAGRARVSTKRAQHGRIAKSAFYRPWCDNQRRSVCAERVAAFNPGVNAPTFHPVELNNFQVGFDSPW